MTTARISSVLAAAALAAMACSDTITRAEDPQGLQGEPSLDIVGGDGQADTVTKSLPEPLVVAITVDTATGQMMAGPMRGPRAPNSVPAPGVLVNFRVTTSGCGEPFAGSALTDSDGLAADLWTLGTKAGNCRMEVRAVTSDGTPMVYDTFNATAYPGALADVDLAEEWLMLWVGDSTRIDSLVTTYADEFSNAIAGPYAFVADGPLAVSGSVAVAEHEGEGAIIVGSGSAVDAVVTHSLHDLRDYQWTVTAACTAISYDSLRAVIPIDSVVYDHVSADSVVAHFYGEGQQIRYHPEYADTFPWTIDRAYRQTPGQLEWRDTPSLEVQDTAASLTYRSSACSGLGTLELRAE